MVTEKRLGLGATHVDRVSHQDDIGSKVATETETYASATHVDETGQIDASVLEAIYLAEDVGKSAQSPWTVHMFRLYGCLAVAYLCAFMNGYDGAWMGGVNGMNSYLRYFHQVSASSSTGFIFAIYSIGSCCATPFTGPVNDYLGRRAGIFTAACIVMVGTCVTATASNKQAFLAGRFLLGMGACFGNVSGPVYVSEMAHPLWRGTTMGLYSTFAFLGSILAAWIVYAVQYQAMGFRIPIWGQFIPSGLIFILVWWIPESPRWLMAQGREEESKRVLVKFHGQGDPNNPVATLAWREMQHQIDTNGSDKKWWDYSELWNTHARRRRLICVVGMACFGQWSGNSSTSFYFPVMVENAGITSQQTKLLLNGINAPMCFFAVIFGARISDKFGRRPLLLTSLIIVIVLLYTITAVSKYANTHPTNHPAANATIGLIYLFSITVSSSLGTLSPVYIPECLETNSRAKGKSLALLVVSACSAIVTYASGPAFQHLKYYFYLVFAVWDTFEWIIIYFFFPETKDRTLEELVEVFESRNPVKKSLEKRTAQTVMNTLEVSKAADPS